MSARIIDSGHYVQSFQDGDKNKITIQLPKCDYIELVSGWVEIPYVSTTVTSSNSCLTSEVMDICPTKIVLVASGSSSSAPYRYYYSRDSSYSLGRISVTLNSDYKLTSQEFDVSSYYRYEFDWYYTCYKYN